QFEILERIGLVAYRLRLPEELSSVQDTFHVSNLKKCLADANLHVSLDEIKVDKTFHIPTGKDNIIVSAGRAKVIHADRTILVLDLTTKEIVAVGKGSRCLYICKPMVDPASFAASIAEF
ncbi:hypothetical protein Tco_1481504, partial [Tanacetum coccineum]